jgi:hypothetical protein
MSLNLCTDDLLMDLVPRELATTTPTLSSRRFPPQLAAHPGR